MRLLISTRRWLFWSYSVNQVIRHADLMIPFRQCFVVMGNGRGRQHIVTKIFKPPQITVPLRMPWGAGLVSDAAQLNTIQVSVSRPHFIKYLCGQWMIYSRDEPFSVSTHDCFLLCNGITSVMFKVVIDRGNDRGHTSMLPPAHQSAAGHTGPTSSHGQCRPT